MATTKRPPISDISTDPYKKSKIQQPRLNARSRKALLYHHISKHLPFQGISILEHQLRALTINKYFLNSFFDDENQLAELCIVTIYNVQLKFRLGDLEMILQPNRVEHLTFLLKLTSAEKIRVCAETWVSSYFRKNMMNNWVQVCQALKENTAIKDIYVRMKSLYSPANRLIFDLIPDKITKLHVDEDVMSCLDKRRKTLGCLTINECRIHKNLSYIFKMKAKKVHFVRAPWNREGGKDGILSLVDCKSFSPNTSIESIKINIQFALVKKPRLFFFEIDKNEPEVDWTLCYLPRYERALKCLKMINPGMVLELINSNVYKEEDFKNYKEIIEHVERLIKNAKQFVDLAQQIGIKIENIEFRHKYNISYNTWSHEQAAHVARKFQLKLAGADQLYGYHFYNDVKLVFYQKFVRQRRDLMFESLCDLLFFCPGDSSASSDSSETENE